MHGLRKTERALVFVSLFALLGILASCKNAKEDTPLDLQRASEERGTAESQGASQGIDLVRDLVLGDTEEGFFAQVTDVAVDRHGRIYIADRSSYQIKIFSATGQSIMNLGSNGQGPGEFASLASIHIGRGDTLFAYDSRQRRMSVFAPAASPQFAYSLIPSGRSGVMRAIFGPVAGGYLVGYMEKGGLDPAQNPQHIYRTNYQGEVSGQALLSIPQQQTILQISGGVFSVTNLPFGRKPVLRLGPERQYVYYGWSDSLSIGIYALDGREVKRIKAAYQPVKVTREDREQELGSVDDEQNQTMQRNAECAKSFSRPRRLSR